MRNGLWLIVAAELLAAGALIATRCSQPTAPRVDLARMVPSTARDLRIVEKSVASQKPEDWQALGEGYLAYGYFPAGEACLRRANQLKPNDPQITMNLARCLERLWKIPEANQFYEQSAKSGNEKNAQMCYFRIGRNHLRLDSVEQAMDWLKKSPEHRPAVFELARLYHKVGKEAESAAIIEDLRRKGKMESAVEMLAIKVYEALGNTQAMVDAIERIERSSPGISGDGITGDDHAEYFNPIRRRFGMLKDLTEANDSLSKRKMEEAWKSITRCYREAGLENVEPILSTFLMNMVIAGHREDALRMVEQAAKVQELYGLNLHMRASVYHLNGRPEIAEALFILANRQMPAVPSYSALHNIYSARKDQEKLAANDREGAFRAAEQLYFESKLKEALGALTALPDGENDSRVKNLIGSIHQAEGRVPQAIAEYESSLKLNPNNGVIREKLELLQKVAASKVEK